MNRIFPVLLAISFVTLFACKGKEADGGKTPTRIDTLEKEIDDAHIVGMGKMGRLTKLQQETARLLDSLGRLPAKARQQAGPARAKLDSLKKELEYAEFAMDKWMAEYYSKKDTLVNDAKAKIDWLLTEKIKVDKLKETILDGIKNADSILHKKL